MFAGFSAVANLCTSVTSSHLQSCLLLLHALERLECSLIIKEYTTKHRFYNFRLPNGWKQAKSRSMCWKWSTLAYLLTPNTNWLNARWRDSVGCCRLLSRVERMRLLSFCSLSRYVRCRLTAYLILFDLLNFPWLKGICGLNVNSATCQPKMSPLANSTQVFALAESLGGYESLAELP